MTPQLRAFIDVCTATVAATPTPADSVERLAAPMLGLVGAAESFLEPRDRRSGDDGYSRNLIYAAADDTLSLYRSSGVRSSGRRFTITVLGGRRRGGRRAGGRNFARVDEHHDSTRDDGIDLTRTGIILLHRGSNDICKPDHIH